MHLRRVEHAHEVAFDQVVGASRVAGRGSDAAVSLVDERLGAQRFVGRIGPKLGAHALMQAFCKRLGQAIGKGFEHDRRVVVMVGQKFGLFGLQVQASGDGEHADVIGLGLRTLRRRDEVGQAAVGTLLAIDHRAFGLHAQRMPAHEFVRA